MVISDQNGSAIKMNNTSNTKKNRRLRKIGFIIIILILVVIASYFVVFQNRFGSPSPTITLDEEQEQIDNFLANYYLAYRDGSVERILTFFEDDAILSAPDGKMYEARGGRQKVKEVRTQETGARSKCGKKDLRQKAKGES